MLSQGVPDMLGSLGGGEPQPAILSIVSSGGLCHSFALQLSRHQYVYLCIVNVRYERCECVNALGEGFNSVWFER
eukprot:m.7078 g.7078  ORF g.7078 m.7078 type:complete len:75 (+) comp5215_c0_seq1:1663-1887(+)